MDDVRTKIEANYVHFNVFTEKVLRVKTVAAICQGARKVVEYVNIKIQKI